MAGLCIIVQQQLLINKYTGTTRTDNNTVSSIVLVGH